MKALYRKYRPTKLSEVVGQEQVVESLSESLKQGRIGHAYIFTGPRGTGKTSIARIFAHEVNHFDYQLEDDYLDIVEIDAASNNGVDNIRELREKAIIAPTSGKYKVYIIDEAHMLTKSAANALLKLLEEPPSHVIFILATTEIDKIPITIRSRAQVYGFSLADSEMMAEHLGRIAKEEGIKIDEPGLAVVARRSGGSFRDALSLLEQVATLTDDKITAETIERALGVPSQVKIAELLDSYAAQDTQRIEQGFKALLSAGLRAESIAGEMIAEIIAQPSSETLPLLGLLPEVAPPFAEAKLLLALLKDSEVKRRAPVVPQAEDAGVTHRAAEPPSLETTKPTPEIETRGSNTVASEDFDWNAFIASVKDQSLRTAQLLEKAQFEFDGTVLHLYPDNSFAAKVFQSEKNTALFKQFLGDYGIQVHEANSRPIDTKDETIAQVSAIMGNIQEVDGEMPF